jgi:hypothetical protein
MPDRAGRDPAGGWWHPGWSWTVRHDRLIPALYWVAGLFIAFALGNVPSLVTGDWKSGTTWASLWLSIGSAVLAAIAFALAETARRRRDAMIEQNGTAYIIQEQARFWDKDTAGRFREGIRRRFARVIQVPGPVEASRGWDWSLDGDASHWDGKADELVRAFRVLAIDKDRDATITPNGVFLWAYWAVAMAFGMRLTAIDRDTVLDVWQRPSRARAGQVDPETWAQRPHRFTSAPELPRALQAAQQAAGTPGPGTSGPELAEHVWPVELEVSRAGRSQRGARHSAGNGDACVLLLRFSESAWGPLPAVSAPQPQGSLSLHLRAAAGLALAGASAAELHELRCVPPSSPSGAQFPWEQFPALAAEAAGWIERKAKELDGRTLLLGTLLPQEVGLGLGILAGQESRRATWPQHLWPIILDPPSRDLVIPALDLGTAAIASARPAAGA